MSKKKLAGVVAVVIMAVIVVVAVVAPPPDSEEIDSPGARAEFVLSNLIVSPAEVEPGDTVTVTVDVQNVGGEEGTHLLQVAVDGLVEQSEDVTLDAGETTSVSFLIQKETVGSYSVELGALTGAFLVIEPASAPPNATEPIYITIGSHKDDVSRRQGEPDGVDTIGSLEMWYYDHDTVYFDRKSGIVTGWYNNTGHLQARVSVSDKNVTSATHIKIGSHKDDVYRIQGEPDGVDTMGSLEMWYYDHDTVYFDRKSGIVTGWYNNTGHLQARVSVSDKNVTSATHIKIGSHKDDVYRIQGEPDGVDTMGSLEMWYHYDGHIYFDGRTNRVTGWQDTTGHLKVTPG